MPNALLRMGAPAGAGWQALSVLASIPWLAIRLGWFGAGRPAVLGLTVDGRVWPFLYIDFTALWLLLPAAAWLVAEPTRRCAQLVVVTITTAHVWLYATESLTRYYGGGASAYDLGNYVQPLWRAANGQSMALTWLGDAPLWADHGAFASVLFVPFSRLFSDAGTGVLLAQALLAAAWIPVVFALARAVGLDRGVALLVTCAAAASRAMQHATSYDFHPECAFPALLLGALAAYERARFGAMACCVVLAALLKEMAALTVGMAMLYLAIARRDRRCLVFSVFAFVMGAVDMFLLPKLGGPASYVAMNAHHRVDYALAFNTTAMRALTTMLVGWLHPLSWFAGSPWALAAGLSGKVAVKGILYQYGFMHVPVAFAGAIAVFAALRRRGRRIGGLVLLWSIAVVTVNAQSQLHARAFGAARARFDAIRRTLLSPEVAPPGVAVATDACLAPYLMERATLAGLCVLDQEEFSRTSRERWTLPSENAFRADRIVVDTACKSHGSCVANQLAEARRRGYREGVRGPRLQVLIKP
jgi:uncharacterized membrane protein